MVPYEQTISDPTGLKPAWRGRNIQDYFILTRKSLGCLPNTFTSYYISSLVLHMLWRKRAIGKQDLAEVLPLLKYTFFFYPSRNSSSPIIQTSLSRRKRTLFYIATHLPCKGWWKVYLEAGRSAQAQQYRSTEGTCSRNAYHVYKHQCENSHGHNSLWLKTRPATGFWISRYVKTQGACLNNSRDSHKRCGHEKLN